jgi:outer membrane protein OmpA-like peptidoglycan-associated protein
LVKQLTSLAIHFDSGSPQIAASEAPTITELKTALHELDQLAQQAGKTVSIEVIGGTDERGSESLNLILAMGRAQRVLSALGGKEAGAVTTLIAGVEPPRHLPKSVRPSEDASRRHVTFAVHVSDTTTGRERR